MRQCCKIFVELNFLHHVEDIRDTWLHLYNHLRLLSQNRFDNVELPVRVENRSKTFEILLVKYVCMFGFHNKHCLTSRFCLSMFKNIFLLSTSKNCLSSTYFGGGQTDIVLDKQIFTLVKQCLFVWLGLLKNCQDRISALFRSHFSNFGIAF